MEIFNIGLGEMLLIFVIALLVFGPERLPELARQTARFVNQLRGMADEVQRAIMTEQEEITRPFNETRKEIESLSEPFKETKREIQSLSEPFKEVKSTLSQPLIDREDIITTPPPPRSTQQARSYEPPAADVDGEPPALPQQPVAEARPYKPVSRNGNGEDDG